MRATIAVLLFASALAAGCVGGEDTVSGVEEAISTEDVVASSSETSVLAAPPVWSVGDFWTYANTDGGGGTFVVAADGGDHWITMTTDEDTAWYDARTDVSFLGPQRKSDLAGSQGDDWVRFYEWPLAVGRTWTTPWDGEELTVEVVSIDGQQATLEARAGDALRVRYVYDASVRWTSDMMFFDADGTEFGARVTDHGSAFAGELVRWVVASEVRVASAFGAIASEVAFDVPEGATDIFLDGNVMCPSGALDFGFGPETDLTAGWGVMEVCPYEAVWSESVVEAPEPGAWSGGVLGLSPVAEGSFDATIWVRTLETVAIG